MFVIPKFNICLNKEYLEVVFRTKYFLQTFYKGLYLIFYRIFFTVYQLIKKSKIAICCHYYVIIIIYDS